MTTLFIGIDPGITGGVAALDESGRLLWAHRTPTVADDYDLAAMARMIAYNDAQVALEAVGAARVAGRQQGGSSMFTFGKGYGIWIGIIATLELPRIDVKPQAWTKELLAGMPKSEDPKLRPAQRKANAAQRAIALWPSIPIKFKADWAKADAALIAEYARRRHVGALSVAADLNRTSGVT